MPNNNSSHRNTRDERKAKEIADLRRENRHLTRRIARLRKERDTLEAIIGKNSDEQFYSPLVKQPKQTKIGCDNCGSTNLLAIELPSGKSISYCRECKTRREETE